MREAVGGSFVNSRRSAAPRQEHRFRSLSVTSGRDKQGKHADRLVDRLYDLGEVHRCLRRNESPPESEWTCIKYGTVECGGREEEYVRCEDGMASPGVGY